MGTGGFPLEPEEGIIARAMKILCGLPALFLAASVSLGAQAPETFKARLGTVPVEAATLAGLTGASGAVTVVLTGTKLSVNGTFKGLQSPATVARLHVGPDGAARPGHARSRRHEGDERDDQRRPGAHAGPGRSPQAQTCLRSSPQREGARGSPLGLASPVGAGDDCDARFLAIRRGIGRRPRHRGHGAATRDLRLHARAGRSRTRGVRRQTARRATSPISAASTRRRNWRAATS